MEKETLYHLKNLINCTAVPRQNPEAAMKATEDFYLAVCTTCTYSSSSVAPIYIVQYHWLEK